MRLQRLSERIPHEQWPTRRDPDRWSVAECVAHLNLTSEAYLPLLDAAVQQAHASATSASVQYRRDLFGWLLWRMMGPPVRFAVATPAAFVPAADLPPTTLIQEFGRLQATQMEMLESVDGKPISRIYVASPFSPGRTYNLYSCFSILPRHQHRHLWQAEQIWESASS
ncbi:MAG: DinB family protein [Gemmatimonadales bacterium]